MIAQEDFGITSEGDKVIKYTLSNKNGFEVHLLNYGLVIQKILYPASNKEKQDIVLGYDSLKDYEEDQAYIGCIVGRNANRLSNGSILINDKEVQLTQNEETKQLHGGVTGFNKKKWSCSIVEIDNKQVLIASYKSAHLEEGFPGELKVTVSFELTDKDELEMSYTATTDKATVVNLTRHDYFNLKDGGISPIKDHSITINANQYTVNDVNGIPTGEILSTKDSPLNFSLGSIINNRLTADLPMGYDHNFVIDKQKKECAFAASAEDPASRRKIKIYTTQPGVQFYTAAYLSDVKGKESTIYNGFHGLCLETQHFPDATKHTQFESTILHPHQTYAHKLIYKFTN